MVGLKIRIPRLKTGFYLDLLMSKKTKLAVGDRIRFDIKFGTIELKKGDACLFYKVGSDAATRFILHISRFDAFIIANLVATVIGADLKQLETDRENLIIYEFI